MVSRKKHEARIKMARSLEEIEASFQAEQEQKLSDKRKLRNKAKVRSKEVLCKEVLSKEELLDKAKARGQAKSNNQSATSIRTKLAMVLIFLIGMGIFIYPSLSDYVARRNVIQGSTHYERQITDLSDEAIEKMWKEARQYNDSLNGDPVPDPFIPGSGRILPENYLKVLDTEDGIMGYVDIEKIKVYLPIYHGSSDEVLEKGAGHIEQTTLPIGGNGNLSVITAHTGYSGAEMFNRLIELIEGDTFKIHVLDETFTYQVDDIKVIEPEEIESLLPVEGKDYVTLVTCTPYGVNSHRLLVRGERIANAPEQVKTKVEEVPFPWELMMVVTLLGLLFLSLLLWNHYWGGEKGQSKCKEKK